MKNEMQDDICASLSLTKDRERFLRWGHANEYSNLKAKRDPGLETVK